MLRSRVLTAAVLLSAFLACLFLLPEQAFAALPCMIVVVAAWEWGGLTSIKGLARYGFAAGCAAAYALVAFGLDGRHLEQISSAILYGLAAGFWVLVAPAWLALGVRLKTRPLAIAIGALVIIPAALAMAGLRERSPALLLALLALVWVADCAAYFAGRRFGRRKLAPATSPGKTWEGVAGGLAASLAYAIILALAAPRGLPVPEGWMEWAAYALIAVLLCALSVVGDLFESAAKRQAGVKDSGALLPGHGGVLDRIDSATSTLPVAALMLFFLSRGQ
ncbi:MAG: phosphatidate cytidylyltransferase [Betaproteobacteria bacterium]|nr:phosphatidate cytidylyltransferase [Betaproteobacteria bacterium]